MASSLHPQQQPLVGEVQAQCANPTIIVKRFPKKHHPRSLGLNLCFGLWRMGFGD
jgi:hypothetical protein